MNCCTRLTYVYSSPCISYLRELIDVLGSTFSISETMEDMFWIGVFCNPETYANYRNYEECNDYVPELLKSDMQSPVAKIAFVEGMIEKIVKGVEDKPEWMFFVEEHEAYNNFQDMPSTFLYIYPKDPKYSKLAEALTKFLYSPNLVMTIKTR